MSLISISKKIAKKSSIFYSHFFENHNNETETEGNVEQAVDDEEVEYQAVNDETTQSSFDFLNKEENVSLSEQGVEQTPCIINEEQSHEEEKSSFDFMKAADTNEDEHDASQEYQSMAENGENEKSSFDFIQ
ncbi:hypothetical protein C9374_011061 [Naegleria lovaniensis]|uniref:Uncharacterized protein n=1 Tax=Naegleria lovaniensis TaxID=51637 RepID=A0AA88KF40_NAELO|nr:uncharacterized protein C9374_011061 [Naegleria lovaniensis]KAG2374224.1 hypothetical protein C9374_011061 [Naegleria lovaniensis]